MPDAPNDFRALIGSPLKVVFVDYANDTFYARYADGRFTWVHSPSAELPEVDEFILFGQSGWIRAPRELWMGQRHIANVSHILDDGTILLDDGLSLRTVTNPEDLDIEVGNAVEFDETAAISLVLSSTPLRSQRFAHEQDLSALDYLRDQKGVTLSFDDFGGYPTVIERAKELIATQFEGRKYLEKIGARPVRGVLLTGPPGTGKTHLARIIASVTGADFYLIRGPEIVSKWLGDTEGILRRIFEAARDAASGRAIIFFDEIDSIAERRSGETHEASKRLVAQLLTLMDGFDDKGNNVMVIAATNRVKFLDPAVTRAGRFDWEIPFGVPTIEDRFDILRVSKRGLSIDEDIDLWPVAEASEGWSAAELASLWPEAALLAATDRREMIAGEDLARAFERIAERPRHFEDSLE